MTAEDRVPPQTFLEQRRRQALRVLRIERFCRAAWPAIPAVLLFISLGLLDVWPFLPPWLHLLALAVFWAGLIVWLALRLRALPSPVPSDADRRLEREAGLAHRPLAVLEDRPAEGSGELTRALWQAHVQRALEQVRQVRTGRPRPGIAARDRFALRALSLLVLAVLAVSAGGDGAARLSRAVWPVLPPSPPAAGPQVQAWIAPPAYTGLPPVFLRDETDAAHQAYAVPAGSVLSLTVSGLRSVPELEAAGASAPLQRLAEDSFQAVRALGTLPGGVAKGAASKDIGPKDAGKTLPSQDTARLVLRQADGSELAAWRIRLVADAPPAVAFTEPPGKARRGYAVRIPWEAHDDYGIASVTALLHLAERPDLPPVTVSLPVPAGHPRAPHAITESDLSANPWAGLPVLAELVATDTAGQTGHSPVLPLQLPERPFHNPLAQLLLRVRQSLARVPEDRRNAVGVLAEVGDRTDMLADDPGGYLNLRAITAELARNRDPSAVDEVLGRLWQLALHLEEGGAERTARALSAARQELQESLARQKDGEPADRREMQRLMQQLERAIGDHLKALAEQAKREGAPPDAVDHQSSALDRLRRMDEAMRQALQEGRLDDARRTMAELDRALQQLQKAKPLTAEQKARRAKRQEARRQAQEQMKALRDLTRRQAGLLDNMQKRAEAAPQDMQRFPDFGPPGDDDPDSGPQQDGNTPDQPQSGQNQSGRPGSNRPGLPQQTDRRPGGQSGASAQQQADAAVEHDLRRALAELMQKFSDRGGEIPRGMAEADSAMHDAIDALHRGRDDQAGDAERKALEKLTEGDQDMRRQMTQQGGKPGQDQGQGRGDDGDEDEGAVSFGSQGAVGRSDDGSGQDAGDQEGKGDDETAGSARDRQDPFGRSRSVGAAAGDENGDDVKLPGQMEPMRSRDVQQELRRRGAERNRPQEELDYINRLLRQF